jgi:hypothetical protein
MVARLAEALRKHQMPLVESGFYNGNIEVELDLPFAQCQIRYTLMAASRTPSSALYTAPLADLPKIRPCGQGLLPVATCPARCHAYLSFREERIRCPWWRCRSSPKTSSIQLTGIYPNYTQDWGRPVQVEFFEEDGKLAFSQAATAEIHGTGSAAICLKNH